MKCAAYVTRDHTVVPNRDNRDLPSTPPTIELRTVDVDATTMREVPCCDAVQKLRPTY